MNSLGTQMLLLSSLQALFILHNVAIVSIATLVGVALGGTQLVATLPVTGYLLGGALFSMPVGWAMRRWGRRGGFSISGVVVVIASTLGWWAVEFGSLTLLLVAAVFGGANNAFGATLRFAAADVADHYRPAFKPQAMSLVLTGGLIGGLLGPELAKWSRTALPTLYAGTYLALIALGAVSLLLAQGLRIPRIAAAGVQRDARALREIVQQPLCAYSILVFCIAGAAMNLLMLASPLAMAVCGHAFSAITVMMQAHIVGMFATGFFTGSLIARFGEFRVVGSGIAAMLAGTLIAFAGDDYGHFAASMFLSGFGWNLTSTAASTLLTRTYRPSEKEAVQGFLNTWSFVVLISSSASGGVLMHASGWNLMNAVTLGALILLAGLTLRIMMRNSSGLPGSRP